MPRSCRLPDASGVQLQFRSDLQAYFDVRHYARFLASPLTSPVHGGPFPSQCIEDAKVVVRMAIALLRENRDLVQWSLCQVRELLPTATWEPREVLDFVDGNRPMDVWFVNRLLFENRRGEIVPGPAAGAAFAINVNANRDGALGTIIPLGHGWWRCWVNMVTTRHQHAFEALVAAAGNQLHEIAHVVLDQHPGGRHPGTCPDTVRMVESAFYWAMKTRYRCFATMSPCILDSQIGSDQHFLDSEGIAGWQCGPASPPCQGGSC